MLSKLFLSKPARMAKAKVYALKDETDAVLLAVQASGCVQPVRVRELTPVELRAVEEKVGQVQKSLARIKEILAFLASEEEVLIGEVDPYTVDDLVERCGKLTEEVHGKLKTQEENCSKLDAEKAKIAEEIKILEPMAELCPSLTMSGLNYDGNLLFSSTIVAGRDVAERLEGDLIGRFNPVLKATAKDQSSVTFAVYGFATSKRQLLDAAKKFNTKLLDLPKSSLLASEYVENLKETLEAVNLRKQETEKEMQALIEEHLDEIVVFRELLENELERLKVLELASESRFSHITEAWIPLSQRDELLVSLDRSVRRYYVDFEEPEESDVPSKLDNLKPIQAFETITKFYGSPGYNEPDPTPLLAYSFTFFFSFMLSDAVYGAILILATKFLLDRLVEDPESPGSRLFKRLLYIVGVGSTIGGVLSGSYAGDAPRLLGMQVQPILHWFTNPVELIIVSMIVGLLHVNIAYFLKLLNFVRAKNIFGTIGSIGFVTAQVFGIPCILKAVFKYNVAGFEYFPGDALLYGAIICIATYVVCKIRVEGAFGLFLWIFDVAGLLGDVLSYTRLAGLALSAVFLASAFNLLCKMTFQGVYGISPNVVGLGLGIILSTAVFAFGHLMNVALGVIGSFVHSLRLCSVEFLPKFFSGSGSEFDPVKFKINKRIVVHGLKA